MNTTPPRPGLAARYGLLGLPLAFVALPVYVHLPNHYAQTHGVALGALGAVLLLSRGVDAVVDPWLGRLGDRLYRHSWRAVWRAAVVLALLVALGFAGLFFPPWTDSPGMLLAWAAVMLTLSHLAYSGLMLLHQAWAARQGGGVPAQSRWVAWREGLGLCGVLLASALPSLAGWKVTTAVLVVMLVVGLGFWQQAAHQSLAQPAPAADVPEPRGAIWQPWREAAFRRLLAVFVVNGLASAIPATLVLFFVQDRLQAAPALEPLFLGLYFAAGALSFPVWLRVIARIGLVGSWLWGMLLSVLAFGGVLLLGPGDSHAFLLVCALSGLALGADLTVPAALLNQTIDACGQRQRSEGAFMGWWNLATKLNLALAAGLALPLLQLWGYAPGRQTPEALWALGLAYGLLPCVLKLAAAALAWRLLHSPTSPLRPLQGT
jgi:GPH family glycoside/pentoside/hexuronide:cation symporter